MALEEAFQVTVDEAQFAAAQTVGDLEALTQAARSRRWRGQSRIAEPIDFPAWNRSWPVARAAAGEPADLDPAARRASSCSSRSDGLEHLESTAGPGDLRRQPSEPLRHAGDPPGAAAALALSGRAGDGQGVLQGALLPRAIRPDAPGSPTASTTTSPSLFFNAFPLPQRETGTRQTLRYIGELVTARILGADLPGGPADRRTGDRTGSSPASA